MVYDSRVICLEPENDLTHTHLRILLFTTLSSEILKLQKVFKNRKHDAFNVYLLSTSGIQEE